MTRCFVALCLMMAASTTANAQFGSLLKKAKDKATSAVKSVTDDVKKSTKSATSSTAATAKSAATSTAETATDAPIDDKTGYASSLDDGAVTTDFTKWPKALVLRGNFKPSKEALAADPQASVTTVEKHWTKSPAEIRAIYEHALNPKIFPYQPYYTEDNRLFYEPDSMAARYTYLQATQLMAAYDYNHYNWPKWGDFVRYKEDNKVVPRAEYALNSFLASFVADPASREGAWNLIKFLVMCDYIPGLITIPVDDPYKYLTTVEGKEMQLNEKETDRQNRWSGAKLTAPSMLEAMTPFNTHASIVVSALVTAEKGAKEGKYLAALSYLREARKAMKLLKERDDYPNDEDSKQLEIMYERVDKRWEEFVDAVYASSSEGVAMPKAHTVAANIQAKAEAEGKKVWGDNLVKTIFTESTWHEFKSPKWPYPVTHRAMSVDYIEKVGDNYFVNHWNFQQMYDNGKPGTRYQITAANGNHREKVNYK